MPALTAIKMGGGLRILYVAATVAPKSEVSTTLNSCTPSLTVVDRVFGASFLTSHVQRYANGENLACAHLTSITKLKISEIFLNVMDTSLRSSHQQTKDLKTITRPPRLMTTWAAY